MDGPDIRVPVITVDGPGGTGKGTLCAALAKSLGWHLLDSGALYRVAAYAARRQGIAATASEALAQLASDMQVRFCPGDDAERVRVLLEDRDVTSEIRSEESGDFASRIAALPEVRRALLGRQTAFRRPPGLVADGRDMGTVVFPDAEVKIFLTATPEQRAQRRYKQLIEKGISVNLARLLDDIVHRDARDAHRSVSPLKPASDAVVLDTTNLNIATVEATVVDLLRAKGFIVSGA